MHAVDDLAVRPARVGDEDAIVALTRVIAAAEGVPGACRANPADVRTVVLEESRARGLVACSGGPDGPVVGSLLFYPSYPSFSGRRGFFIENLAVDPTMQGRGIATALFEALLDVARAEGVGKLEWACERSNAAREFYEHRLGALPEEQYMLFAYEIDQAAADAASSSRSSQPDR